MRNIKLVLEYDGTEFSGWQVQPDRRTVQGMLEGALEELLQSRVKVTGAGRTDGGVHALHQVANFETSSAVSLNAIKGGVNSLLPSDILVKSAEEMGASFNARRDARSRFYRYRILCARSPLRRRYAWELKYSLKLKRMRVACSLLCGVHDLSSFTASPLDGKVRVLSCEWKKKGDELWMEVKADRFLHHMVRIVVGTVVDVGRGRLAVDDFAGILEARDRTLAGPTAPPQGLCLLGVEY